MSTVGIDKPKIGDLRESLDKIVSANVMTRLEGLAGALQWYDKARDYLIDRGKLTNAELDPTKNTPYGKMNKRRALGVSSTFPAEKENSLWRAVKEYQEVCDTMNPVVDTVTGRRQVDVKDYYDEYNKKKAELEDDEKRAQAKYQPVMDFLNTVFGNLGFKITIDPNTTKYKQFSGPPLNEITYSNKAVKDIFDTLRTEGMLVAMKKELMLFSRAKAMSKDTNDQWEIKYDVQIATIDKMLDEFINYARLDMGRWKLLRYGASNSSAQAATAQAGSTTSQAPKPSTPKPARPKAAGSSHIGDYAPGTPMYTVFERLKGGKVVSKADLYAGLGKMGPNSLSWIIIHGKKSGKWTVNKLAGDKYQMVTA